MSVSPSLFVSAMDDHWQHQLNLVSSLPLRAVWEQMAVTFNRQIAAYGTADGDRWQVLQPPTGTGKTQGLAVYCSMLPLSNHPGVLVVTRRKEQASEIARTVNELAAHEVARAHHTDSPATPEELSASPVLVITHKAYELGLDRISRGDASATCWSRLHSCDSGPRRLVVIDEALDVIEEAQIELNILKVIQAILPADALTKHPYQRAALEFVVSTLEGIRTREDRNDGPSRERVLNPEELSRWADVDMTPLRMALRDVRLDRCLAGQHDLEQNTRIRGRYDQALKAVEVLLEQWAWYAKKMGDHTLNSARLILPQEGCGAVVLDATADANVIYRLFQSRARIVKTPGAARRYDNVTLHVSMGHAVGKTTLRKTVQAERANLLQNLKASLSPDRRLFVCCHKDVEHHLVGLDTGFSVFDVGHWQAIDGRNDWQNHDTAVIFGLPYRDSVWSANTYMAICGVQNDEWLNAEGHRPFESIRDIRHALVVGQLVVSVVQAINRVHCRRVIDADGNCPKTDVFILLPKDKTGQELLRGITKAMPGISVIQWSYSSAKRRVRKSSHDEGLVRFASSMMSGRWSISEVAKELSIPKRSMQAVLGRIKDTSSVIYTRLAELGVHYVVEGAGRGARSYLDKA